jgi:two-component system osmolarity sensor histidine kinase EnvZ
MASMLLLSQLLTTVLISLLVIRPQAARVAGIVASNVRMVGATLDALPPDERERFVRRINMSGSFRLQPGYGDPPGSDGQPSLIETTVLRTLAADLAQSKDMVWRGGGNKPLWVRLRLGSQGYYWISVAPSPGWTPNGALLGSVALALVISLAAGLALQRRINRPLAKLAAAVDAMPDPRQVRDLSSDGPAEIAQVAASFDAMANRLAAQDANRTLMLAGISHDLKTPLAKIRLALELDPPNDRGTIDLLNRQLDRMAAMLDQFLDFGRGVDAEPIKSVEVIDIVEAAISAAGSTAKVISWGATSPKVAVRPRALERALVNLLRNAALHGAPPVRVAIDEHDCTVSVAVYDGGPGIPPDMLATITDPFVRAEPSRPSDGSSGLGLAIVDRFARDHAGAFSVASLPDSGFVAKLELPAAR